MKLTLIKELLGNFGPKQETEDETINEGFLTNLKMAFKRGWREGTRSKELAMAMDNFQDAVVNALTVNPSGMIKYGFYADSMNDIARAWDGGLTPDDLKDVAQIADPRPTKFSDFADVIDETGAKARRNERYVLLFSVPKALQKLLGGAKTFSKNDFSGSKFQEHRLAFIDVKAASDGKIDDPDAAIVSIRGIEGLTKDEIDGMIALAHPVNMDDEEKDDASDSSKDAAPKKEAPKTDEPKPYAGIAGAKIIGAKKRFSASNPVPKVWKAERGVFEISPADVVTDLVGSPSVVMSDFLVDGNKLKSLKGAPSRVAGDFSVSHNGLTRLPRLDPATEVEKNVDLRGNNIKSLSNVHLTFSKIGGALYVGGNPIERGVLDVLRVPGLKSINFASPGDDEEERVELARILNDALERIKETGDNSLAISDCERSLADAGLGSFAKK